MPAILNSGSKAEAPERVQFGNFDIINDAEGRPLALGKGTFGRTYQARHRYLDTVVALKIINERYAADAGVRQRFLVEARAVARLSHPHIARLYDFGEVDGVLHYAMEYCGGGSLADQVAKQGPLGLPQVVEVGQQIAGALKCAHGAGFIHRDLKPSNIMLTDAKGGMFAKLIDFGLVQPSLPEASQTSGADQSADGGRFLGTPLFASPEQLKEEPLDVRTDLFSLGMTLWYLLLGRAPDGGSSAEIASSRLSPASYAAQLPALLPTELRDVLVRLLQKDRGSRFASAAEVFAAFNASAAALGLRRARDYTSTDDPTEVDEPEPAPVPQQVAKAEAAEIERVAADLDSEFKIVTRVNDDFTGSNYIAEATASFGTASHVFLHVLHPALVEDEPIFELLRLHTTQLKALNVPEILQPRALRAYSDYAAIVIDKPEGGDLLSVLRAERVVNLVEAAPLLESIATACDRLAAAGLPGPQLAPSYIFVEWPESADAQNGAAGARKLSEARPKLYPRFLAVSEAPDLAKLNEPEDVSSTMTTDMLGDPSRADNVCEHFGTLMYRIVAGRNCPLAASLSSQAYIPVPGLSEQANRTLSLVIAKQIAVGSCGQVLREILAAEGIAPRSPGHPSAGFTAGSGSTAASPGSTPPFPLPTPPKTSTGSTGTSRFRPMPVAPSAAPPPLVVPPPAPVMKSTEAVGNRLAEVEKAPAAETLTPPIPTRDMTPAPPVPPVLTPAPPVPAPTPPEAPAKKSTPGVSKIPFARKERARRDPPKPAPSPLEAVTVVNEKIVSHARSSSPPTVVSPPPVISTSSDSPHVKSWISRHVLPIGIGIAALLVVSVTAGLIQKMRSRNVTDKPTTTSSAAPQVNEPASKPAKDIAVAPAAASPAVVAGPDAAQDKTDAADLAAQDPKAAQKAADQAKLLAEQQNANRPDGSTLVIEPDAAANAKTPAEPTTPGGPKTKNTQKQAQKDSQSRESGRNRATTNSQPAPRPPPAAPVTRPPPAPKPANDPQRHKSEFGATAPGG
jgi:serine/threonine protein kinase